jgi:soluble lytic murein transglycosylase-like protein
VGVADAQALDAVTTTKSDTAGAVDSNNDNNNANDAAENNPGASDNDSAKADNDSAKTSALKAEAPPDLPPSFQVRPPRNSALRSLNYAAIVQAEALAAGIPAEIAEAVMAVESGYDPNVIGADGEIGLMQVLPSTARLMGFMGTTADLAVPATNIHYGVTYLAQAWRIAGRDLCTAVMKYRAGHGETRFSYRSVDYCLRVRAKLAARGYLVAGTVPAATFGESSASCHRCIGVRSAGRTIGHNIDIAALNSRLSQIVFRVSAFKPPGR